MGSFFEFLPVSSSRLAMALGSKSIVSAIQIKLTEGIQFTFFFFFPPEDSGCLCACSWPYDQIVRNDLHQEDIFQPEAFYSFLPIQSAPAPITLSLLSHDSFQFSRMRDRMCFHLFCGNCCSCLKTEGILHITAEMSKGCSRSEKCPTTKEDYGCLNVGQVLKWVLK